MLHLAAPAKLNLFLRVVGKRADGYHELETLFERINLADALTFESDPSKLSLSCDDPKLPCDETNLVLKAAHALRQASGTTRGARIHLTKRIPIGAGLGGGSSDAATTLVGLNRLWNLELLRERLIELGTQLGSDVPFFLGKAPFAIGRGRGERCEELAGPLPTLWQVLVVPPERLSTQAVYEGLTGGLTASGPSISIVVHALRNGPALAGLASGMRNDLAPEAIRRCPIIEEIHARLLAGGCLAAALTGSGSAVYGLVRDARHADEAAQHVRAHRVPATKGSGHDPEPGARDGDPGWLVRVVKTQHETS